MYACQNCHWATVKLLYMYSSVFVQIVTYPITNIVSKTIHLDSLDVILSLQHYSPIGLHSDDAMSAISSGTFLTSISHSTTLVSTVQ